MQQLFASIRLYSVCLSVRQPAFYLPLALPMKITSTAANALFLSTRTERRLRYHAAVAPNKFLQTGFRGDWEDHTDNQCRADRDGEFDSLLFARNLVILSSEQAQGKLCSSLLDQVQSHKHS